MRLKQGNLSGGQGVWGLKNAFFLFFLFLGYRGLRLKFLRKLRYKLGKLQSYKAALFQNCSAGGRRAERRLGGEITVQTPCIRKELMSYTLLQNVVRFANKHSDDPSTKVGACLVLDGKHTFGTNRYYSLPDGKTMEEVNADRSLKYAYITHAEADAITIAGATAGGTLYVNYVPCDQCAMKIAAAGISKVVAIDHMDEVDLAARWNKYWVIGRRILQENGVELVEIK